MEAAKLLFDFVKFAAPLIPGLGPVFKDFWGKNNLGPMPPDIQAWADVDTKIDERLKKESGQ